MMDYDNQILSEFALSLLEGDISYQCSRYHIPGYEREDLEQECRLRVWEQMTKYNPYYGSSFRTWAQNVVKNRLKNLLRDSFREIRKANNSVVYITYRTNVTFEDIYEENKTGGEV